MLLAEVACQVRGEANARVRSTAYLVSALANNLPDIDIAYTWALRTQPLGNLMHDGGRSHTRLLALTRAALLAAGIWCWISRREQGVGLREKQLLFGLSLVGVLMHLLMDFGNTSGVQPLWPWSGR